VDAMAAYVYAKGGQWTQLAESLKAQGKPSLEIAKAYYQGRNFGKAAEYANKSSGVEAAKIVAQSYLNLGDTKKAMAAYTKLIAMAPKSEYIANLANLQFKAGDKKAYKETLAKLIKADPSPANWKLLLGNLKRQPLPDAAKLGLYMLLAETQNLEGIEDTLEFAKLAIVTGSPTMGKMILVDSKSTDPQVQGLIKSSDARIAAANAAQAKLAASSNPSDQLRAGRALLGAGNYPAALALFQKAAGDARAAPEANLFIGLTKLKSGHPGEAMTILKAIPDGSAYGDIAGLWALYSTTKK
ncbi:MAG: tetratricopeptide repeat protein, partial [Candidatus Obscuribacterales bacterium]|nr:tetratricopeptide repeat protein [Candidatus Obscuribacterales bacterium]